MPTEITVTTDNSELTMERSEAVRLQIMQVGQQIHRSFIVLGHLLKEARDNDYHNAWGFARFGEWIETSSGLDCSERSAYDFIKVVERAEHLQITDESLGEYQYSSVKEIFSLPADTDPAKIHALLDEAKTMKAKDVKQLVGMLKDESFTYHTLKFDQETEDNVFQPALERVRREYGSTVGTDGGPQDITDSKAVEMLAAEKLAEPDYDEDVIDGDFTDVLDTGTEEPS